MRLLRTFIREDFAFLRVWPDDRGNTKPNHRLTPGNHTRDRPFMDDTKPANETNEPGLNKIDLSQLQDFTFGTQWTEVKNLQPDHPDLESALAQARGQAAREAVQDFAHVLQRVINLLHVAANHVVGQAAGAGKGLEILLRRLRVALVAVDMAERTPYTRAS